jgi:phosphate acetyltransferase
MKSEPSRRSAFVAPPHSKYERLIARAKEAAPATTVVVYPCDETSLRGPIEAAEAGIIIPILVGPAAKIASVAREHGLAIDRYVIVDVPNSEAAAAKGVELIRESKGEFLMKGSLHTDELMHEVALRKPACEPRGASATSSSWMCRPTPRPCSSPMPRST